MRHFLCPTNRSTNVYHTKRLGISMVDLLKASLFVSFVFVLGCFLILRHLRRQLRQPPNRYLEITALLYKTKTQLPQALKTPQIRRQLILASSRPAALTNLLDMGLSTLDLEHAAKKPLIYGFLHPKADAGGGGERVLWAAVKKLVTDDLRAVAAIYVGAKQSLTQASILKNAAERFNIHFSAQEADRIVVIALTQAWLVDPSTFLVLTLISQAFGMAVLGYEAIANLMPDILVDTTGLAFSYPVVSWFAKVPIVAYVHYPFVQSEMLASVKAQGLNHPKRLAKYVYWKALNMAYKWAGSYADVVAVNSTWTKKHLGWNNAENATIVYPPSAVQDFPNPADTEHGERSCALVYLAQFRREKRHDLVIKSFAKARAAAKKSNSIPAKHRNPHLIFIGSVHDEVDALRVHELRTLATDLGLSDNEYTIVKNAPWDAVKKILVSSLIGLNAMWNEHFGMGVVEVMAAGLIPVVHASAGPLMDIVKDEQGAPGFFFRSSRDPDGLGLNGYPTLSEAILEALALSSPDAQKLSWRAYDASQRFSDASFAESWQKQLDLVKAEEPNFARARKQLNLYD